MKLSTPNPDDRTLAAALAFLKAGGGGLPPGCRISISGWHRAFVPDHGEHGGLSAKSVAIRPIGWCCFVSSDFGTLHRLWVSGPPRSATDSSKQHEPVAIELETGPEVDAWVRAVNKAMAHTKTYQDLAYEAGFLMVPDRMSSALLLQPTEPGADAVVMPLCYRARACQRMNLRSLARFFARCN